MRKTKIVCTLGPATDNEEVLRQMMLEGMNVARCLGKIVSRQPGG